MTHRQLKLIVKLQLIVLIRLDCALSHFLRAQKESKNSLTNGSGFIHKKSFSTNQKFNFPTKIYKIRKH